MNPADFTVNTLPIVQLVGILIIALFIMFFVIWSAVWIYNGFKISSNLKHSKIIPIYAAGIILGMLIPKFLLSLIV